MSATQNRLILWVGEKHFGKTTSTARLVKIARAEGFNVAGLLAPSLYRNSKLIGFDVLDLRDNSRAPLARHKIDVSKTRSFTFIADGLKFGNTALSRKATKSADLVIVDEFGPLELSGQGWRRNVDSLLTSSNATILLVVRQELANPVSKIYTDFLCCKLDASEPKSSVSVINLLNSRRQSQQKMR